MPWIKHNENRLNLDNVIDYSPHSIHVKKDRQIKFTLAIPNTAAESKDKLTQIVWTFEDTDSRDKMLESIDRIIKPRGPEGNEVQATVL